MSCNFISCNFMCMSCNFMSCIFLTRDFDFPSFLHVLHFQSPHSNSTGTFLARNIHISMQLPHLLNSLLASPRPQTNSLWSQDRWCKITVRDCLQFSTVAGVLSSAKCQYFLLLCAFSSKFRVAGIFAGSVCASYLFCDICVHKISSVKNGIVGLYHNNDKTYLLQVVIYVYYVFHFVNKTHLTTFYYFF